MGPLNGEREGRHKERIAYVTQHNWILGQVINQTRNLQKSINLHWSSSFFEASIVWILAIPVILAQVVRNKVTWQVYYPSERNQYRLHYIHFSLNVWTYMNGDGPLSTCLASVFQLRILVTALFIHLHLASYQFSFLYVHIMLGCHWSVW